MYKNYTKEFGVPFLRISKLLLIIRLTAAITIVILMQLSTTSFAQQITLHEKKADLEFVFQEIRKQSGFDFFFNRSSIKNASPVNINFRNASLEEVLKQCFKNQPFTYTIKNKTVIVKDKEPSVIEKVTGLFTEVIVNGQVTDDQGIPVPGVTVKIKSSGRTTSTDERGTFKITAEKENDVLIFSSIGMETQDVNLSNRTYLTVALISKKNDLQEVTINTGYQSVLKEKMTGATVTVGSAELEKRYTTNILDNLEGRIPGLVNYRGTTTIRGISTVSANVSKSPLIVVDGLPIEGSVADINPYDVESVTVLKDAAAAAIYGARATNGVIVITTKRAKGKRTSVEFSSDIIITDKPDIDYNLLTPAQQVDLESSYFRDQFFTNAAKATNIARTATYLTNGNTVTPVQYDFYQLATGKITETDLQNKLAAYKKNDFRKQFKDNALLNNVLQQYNLAVRTDGNRFQSSLVLNYKNDNSGIINAYNRQLNIYYKGTYQISNWLDLGFGVNGILGNAKSSSSSFATIGTNVSPYMQLLDDNGNRAYYTTSDYNNFNTNAATSPVYSMNVNHLDELALDSKITKQQNTRYNVYLTAKIIPGLTFTPQFQYENRITNASAYSEPDSYIMRYLKNIYATQKLLPEFGGKLATSNSSGDYWTARGQFNYSRQIGKHAIDIIAGTEFRQSKIKGTGGLLLGYDDQLQSHSTTTVSYLALAEYSQKAIALNQFKATSTPSGLYTAYLSDPINIIPENIDRYNSAYANATYTYDNKYNAFASYRVDYASFFGLDKEFRGKPLWSAGLGWNIHQEKFMSDVDWVNFLKFRGTYGVTGNIANGVSSYLTANSSLINKLTGQPVSVVINAANPQLRWEKTATTNLGLDFTLLNNRLRGSFDWYRKKGTDLFVTQRIDPSEGFTSQILNNGNLLNNGIELSLEYQWLKPAKRDNFNWSTSFVVSKNSNKITYIDEVSTTPLALAQGGFKVGYPVNSLFSLPYKGLTANGQPQWLKGDGTLTTVALTGNDMSAVVYSGGSDPKVNLSLTNEINYKGFSLYVLAVYYGGQYLRSATPGVYNSPSYSGLPSYLANSWTPENTNTIIPGFGQYAPGYYAGTANVPASHLAYSDAFVISGSFIKIRSAVLGYRLPKEFAAKIGSDNVKVHFQLNNPKAIWTKNNINVDPETGGANVPASYVIGANFNF